MNTNYINVVENIKSQIRNSQHRAILNANKELVILYWNIGKIIDEHSEWGNKFLNNLASEIRLEFPTSKGFSARNLWNMIKFYRVFRSFEIVQTLAAQIPWSHNVEILRVDSQDKRIWYIEQTIENGWSKNVLVHQINTKLYERQNNNDKISNFSKVLSSPQKEMAIETHKDPYVFDFINLKNDSDERDVEDALVENLTKLILELGKGFAFVGKQYHLEVGDEDFYIDLLFYNIKLKCYVVIELKAGKFKPEYTGQLCFYLSAIDELLKDDNDNPTIGLLLCESKNNKIAQFSLKDLNKPIGVSEYKITDYLPSCMKEDVFKIDNIESFKKPKNK